MSEPTKPSRMAFILVGGRSTRMGADKAFLNLGKHTLLDRALSVVRAVCSGVAIVGDRQKFSAYGKVVEDIYPGCGPLGAIHAALLHSPADLNLIFAVDLPFVSTDLLTFLFACAEATDAVVTVPHTTRGFQPLCAIYRRPFAAAAEQALRTGKYKIDALFPALDVCTIKEAELLAAGFADSLFANINTPEDLAAARANPLT